MSVPFGADGRLEGTELGAEVVNCVLGRCDGPAVEYPDGRREWWLDGVHHEGQEVEERRLAWNKAARAAHVAESNRWPVLHHLLVAVEPAGNGMQAPTAGVGDPILKL